MSVMFECVQLSGNRLTKSTPCATILMIQFPAAKENGSAKLFPDTVTNAGSLLGWNMISLASTDPIDQKYLK